MGLMYLTVIGYTLTIGPAIGLIMYYLVKAFDSSESTKIDPKPDTNY